VYTLDARLRGLPVTREQVVSLAHSLNAPHVAIPGRPAGPARAYVVGLRGSAGFAVFVYLFLPEAQDCAVYMPERRNLSAEQYEHELGEAQGFVESMGFMMDPIQFRALDRGQQDELLRTLPVFQRDPKQVSSAAPPPAPAPMAAAAPRHEPAQSSPGELAKLFSAF
jgi:hypothetical protein